MTEAQLYKLLDMVYHVNFVQVNNSSHALSLFMPLLSRGGTQEPALPR